jgi:hypothetical protein
MFIINPGHPGGSLSVTGSLTKLYYGVVNRGALS